MTSQTTPTLRVRALVAFLQLLVNGPAIFRWSLAIFVVIFPPVYLAYNPLHYTPLVDSLFSVFLFLLAYWIGSIRDSDAAAQRANDRWLPQAESVILRLMTLQANVIRFAAITKSSCSDAECELPELNDQKLRAVRIKMKTDCKASSERLVDIGNQLEDAIADWRRFIIANCRGNECERIFEALRQREDRLWNNEGIVAQTAELLPTVRGGYAASDQVVE